MSGPQKLDLRYTLRATVTPTAKISRTQRRPLGLRNPTRGAVELHTRPDGRSPTGRHLGVASSRHSYATIPIVYIIVQHTDLQARSIHE